MIANADDPLCPRSAGRLARKWWAEALYTGVHNPEEWVARQCIEEIHREIERIKEEEGR